MKVAVDSTPRRCAASITDSQTSPDSLSGAIAVRGRLTRISAPAPAKESSPAVCSRWMTSSCGRFDVRPMCTTSDAPSECRVNVG